MRRTDDSQELLRSVDLFAGLKKRDLAKVATAAKEMKFPAGAVVTAEGDKGALFYVIAEGEARVTVKGRKRLSLKAGDYFGEIALLDGGPRTATITAETPLRTFTLARWNLKPLLQGNADITYQILLEMCSRLRSSERSLTT
jgi:CRP/FNR family cyclic AMP-dependent transcriptional regulator